MQEPTEEELKKLDEINVAWLLRQMSLGNLARGFWRAANALKPVTKCVKSCAETQAAEIKRCLEDDEDEEGKEPEVDEEAEKEEENKTGRGKKRDAKQ